jgi:hypothetical protein
MQSSQDSGSLENSLPFYLSVNQELLENFGLSYHASEHNCHQHVITAFQKTYGK